MEKWQAQAPPYNRKFQGRLELIRDTSSLVHSIVIDLGCGEGHFVQGLAPICRHVFGVDSDENEIQKAHDKCKNFSNVTLIHSDIATALEHLPNADVILCLSVFHHILSGSSFYNKQNYRMCSGMDQGLALLRYIRQKTKVLYFEMGMPYEPRVWAKDLPQDLDGRAIGCKLLGNSGFNQVIEYYPPEVMYDTYGFRFRSTTQCFLHDRFYNKLSRSPDWFQKMLGFDNRDNRPFFVAR